MITLIFNSERIKMNNQIKEINSTTHPDLFAAMDAYVVECGFWAYPDAEWQHAFIDSWIGVNPDHSMQ
jgi:hypothetical protein